MKKPKFKLIIISIFSIFILTGCTNSSVSQETRDFIRECNRKSGCSYKVIDNACVCDKTHDYIPGP